MTGWFLRREFLWLLFCGFIFLQWQIWFSNRGHPMWAREMAKIQVLQQKKEHFLKVNRALVDYVLILKEHAEEQMEVLAREELGMVRHDEHFLQFKEKDRI
jgi:hypothetical protein